MIRLYLYDLLLTILQPLLWLISKIGMPERDVNGKDYYLNRDSIEIGTVLITNTKYELLNLINPSPLKHGGIYVGDIHGDGIHYVLEAIGVGVVLTDLVTFMTSKDVVVGYRPAFIVDKDIFAESMSKSATKYIGREYDWLFNKKGKAFYCFELCAKCLHNAYPDIEIKCKEVIKDKRIYDSSSFTNSGLFELVFDTRV